MLIVKLHYRLDTFEFSPCLDLSQLNSVSKMLLKFICIISINSYIVLSDSIQTAEFNGTKDFLSLVSMLR